MCFWTFLQGRIFRGHTVEQKRNGYRTWLWPCIESHWVYEELHVHCNNVQSSKIFHLGRLNRKHLQRSQKHLRFIVAFLTLFSCFGWQFCPEMFTPSIGVRQFHKQNKNLAKLCKLTKTISASGPWILKDHLDMGCPAWHIKIEFKAI